MSDYVREEREGDVVLLTLNAPEKRNAISTFDDCDAIVFGHTHLPTVSRQGETWLLNPGSPTERRRAIVTAHAGLERAARAWPYRRIASARGRRPFSSRQSASPARF